MHKRTAALVLTGALAAGTVGAVAITPASAATSSNPVRSRLAWIKNALSGLVSDGTLTQAQADKVANALNNKLPQGPFGPGGPGGHFRGMGLREMAGAAAKTLGMTSQELMTQLRSGKTLAEIAQSKNVSTDTLVKDIVAAVDDELATAVKAGRITQAQADTVKSTLTQRVTDLVNGKLPAGGFGGGMGHWGGGPGSWRSGMPGAPTTPPSGSTTSGASTTTA